MCIALTISFHVLEYVSDTPLDLAEEDGQMDDTMNVSRGKKTTSTPKETVTDVDLTRSSEHRPAPGGPGGSSPAPSLPEGLPTPTKLKDEEQGRNVKPLYQWHLTSQLIQKKERMVLLLVTRRAYKLRSCIPNSHASANMSRKSP